LDRKKRYDVYTEVHMEAVKVGVREFRQRLASFLEADAPVAITRHGETVGFYIPTRKKPKNEDLTALRTAASRLDAMLEAAGVGEDELVEEFKKARRRSRKQ
jgi:antitoxin (DNA-binding transcriptional repressor) of toxin-antitoxin stability system